MGYGNGPLDCNTDYKLTVASGCNTAIVGLDSVVQLDFYLP